MPDFTMAFGFPKKDKKVEDNPSETHGKTALDAVDNTALEAAIKRYQENKSKDSLEAAFKELLCSKLGFLSSEPPENGGIGKSLISPLMHRDGYGHASFMPLFTNMESIAGYRGATGGKDSPGRYLQTGAAVDCLKLAHNIGAPRVLINSGGEPQLLIDSRGIKYLSKKGLPTVHKSTVEELVERLPEFLRGFPFVKAAYLGSMPPEPGLPPELVIVLDIEGNKVQAAQPEFMFGMTEIIKKCDADGSTIFSKPDAKQLEYAEKTGKRLYKRDESKR